MRLMTSVLDRILDSLAGTSNGRIRRTRNSALQSAVLESLEPRMLMTTSLYYQQTATNGLDMHFEGGSEDSEYNATIYASDPQHGIVTGGMYVVGASSLDPDIYDFAVLMNRDENLIVSGTYDELHRVIDMEITLPEHYLILVGTGARSGVFHVHEAGSMDIWNATDSSNPYAEMLGLGMNVASASQYVSESTLQGLGLADSNGKMDVKIEAEGYGAYFFSLKSNPFLSSDSVASQAGWAVSTSSWQDAAYQILSSKGASVTVNSDYPGTISLGGYGISSTMAIGVGSETYYQSSFFSVGAGGAKSIAGGYSDNPDMAQWNVTSVSLENFNCNCDPIYNPGVVTTQKGGIDPAGIVRSAFDSLIVPGTGGKTLGGLLAHTSPLVLINGDPLHYWSPNYLVTYSSYEHEIFQQTATSGIYVSTLFGSRATLVLSGSEYVLTDADGKVFLFSSTFDNFGLSGSKTGRDPAGNVTTYFTNDSGVAEGFLSHIVTAMNADGNKVQDTAFAYDDAGRITTVTMETSTNYTDGDFDGATWTVQSVTHYTYYAYGDQGGAEGAIQLVTVNNGSGQQVSQTGYRYFDVTSTTGTFEGAVQFTFSSDSMARLTSAGYSLASSSEENIAQYADVGYEYDSDGRVISQKLQNSGCSSCSGGLGTYTYSYGVSDNDESDPNAWTNRLSETRADGSVDTIYTNSSGQTILDVFQNGTQSWLNYFRYDDSGHQVLHVNPSGMATNGTRSFDDSFADLVNYNGTANVYVASSSGLFEWADYGTANTATSTTVGDALGLMKDTAVSQGKSGTKYYQSYTDYIQNDTLGFFQVADSVSFPTSVTSNPGTASTDARVTHYAYTWLTNGSNAINQPASIVTTSPTIATGHNGPGTTSADISTIVFDNFGRTIWTKDGDGFGNYTEYDETTGAVIETILDAASSQLPASLITILNNASFAFHSTGLGLTTTMGIDSLGRTTEVTDPNGNHSYTIYDDEHQAVFTVSGATLTSAGTSGTLTPTGPIMMSRSQIPYQYQNVVYSGTTGSTVTLFGTYSESLTFSGNLTVRVDGDQLSIPDADWTSRGTSSDHALFNLIGNGNTVSAQFTIQSLSRSLASAGSQMIESDSYYAISNDFYLNHTATGSAYSGTNSANFYATTYDYDIMGRQARTVSATGTIQISSYDALGRQRATYVGTDDSPTDDLNGFGDSAHGNWEDFVYAINTNATGSVVGTNMALISLNEYDGGGVGDSNLTKSTLHVAGTSSSTTLDRVTGYFYDWRDRLVATKNAVQSSESTGDNTHFITFNDLDNLGEVTGTSTYDGDNVTLTITNGTVGKPSSSLLRAYSTMAYDEKGRVYQTIQYNVDPSNGTFSTTSTNTLVSSIWYDHRGEQIASHTSGGVTNKMTYDGAGRLSVSYTTDGGAVNNTASAGTVLTSWSDANSVSKDIVIQQMEYTYDANSNVLLTTTRQAFHDNATTGKGALLIASDTTGHAARVSFMLSYYDAANRLTESVNLGTNGGAVDGTSSGGMDLTTIPSAPTASTNTVLATFYGYNDAGEVETVTDPMSLVSKTLYDNSGSQTKTIANYRADINSGNASSSYNQTTLYTYDSAGHIASMTAVMPSGTNSQTTSYLYGITTAQGSSINSNDLLYKIEYPDASTGQSSTAGAYTETFTYNGAGQTLVKTDRNGATHTYTYDILGRITEDKASVKPTFTDLMHADIANSGFEDGTSYWTLTGDSATTAGVITGDGGHVLHLLSPGGDRTYASQVLTVSGTYYLALDAAMDGGEGTFHVIVDGSEVVEFIATSGDYHAFLTPSFALGAGSHTLTLASEYANAGDIFIDNVVLATAATGPSDAGFEYTDVGGDYAVDPTSDWTFSGPAGVAADGSTVYTPPEGHPGDQVAFVGGIDDEAASLSQDLALGVGTYVITFSFAAGGYNNVNVNVGGTDLGNYGASTDVWKQYAVKFTISVAGTYALTFSAVSTTDGPSFIDDVKVFACRRGVSFASIVASQRITTSYNTQGLVDTISSYDAATSGSVVNEVKRTYNGFGQVTNEYQQHGAAVNTSTSPKVTYTYDTAAHGSRLTSVSGNLGVTGISYSYGTGNKLNDVISRLETISSTGSETYGYLGLSRAVILTRGDGTSLTYNSTTSGDAGDKYIGLDRFGRITDQKWINGATLVEDYTYTYDQDSNVLTKVNVNHTSFNETYTYNGLNQLTAVDQATGMTNDQSWNLDALGNMTSVTTNGSTVNRSHNSDNQITYISGATNPAYDSNGSVTTDDSGNTLVWDAWNRLVEIKSSAGFLLKAYTYDGLGRRVTETDGYTVKDSYFNTNWQVLVEKTGGTVNTAYLWSAVYVDALVNRISSADGNYYARYDANFDVTSIGVSTTTTERFLYNAYGKRTDLNSSWSMSADTKNWLIGWQGGYQDQTTKLYLFRARWYSYDLHWLSADPMGYIDGASLYANRAANPINAVDSSGLWKLDGDQAVAEQGDTLSGLSTILFGNGRQIGDLDYQGNPSLIYAGSTKLNVAKWVTPARTNVDNFSAAMRSLTSLLRTIADTCGDCDAFRSRMAKYEVLTADILEVIASSKNQQGIISRLGFGVTVGGISLTAGEVVIGLGEIADKNFFLGSSAKVLAGGNATRVIRTVKIAGKVFTFAGGVFDSLSGINNLKNGNVEDGAADLSLAALGFISLSWGPAGIIVGAAAAVRLGVGMYYDHEAAAANAEVCQVASAGFDKVFDLAYAALPTLAHDLELLSKFH